MLIADDTRLPGTDTEPQKSGEKRSDPQGRVCNDLKDAVHMGLYNTSR
ncbi:MAG: hypothetical protein VX639_06015 [Pseudomonadota bacterium]|nr:hypothetical protein [Pseudomonadota bacterium]